MGKRIKPISKGGRAVSMTFWDTVRGHHLADVLIRELPKLNQNLEKMNKAKQPEKIRIEVRGGVPEVVDNPSNIDVEIVDWNDMEGIECSFSFIEDSLYVLDKNRKVHVILDVYPDHLYLAQACQIREWLVEEHPNILQSLPY